MRSATVGQYYWMQTWGPICISPGDAGSGGEAEERQLVFGGNGGVFAHDAAHATTLQEQHAGFIIQKDSAGGDGPPFIMLQISPQNRVTNVVNLPPSGPGTPPWLWWVSCPVLTVLRWASWAQC